MEEKQKKRATILLALIAGGVFLFVVLIVLVTRSDNREKAERAEMLARVEEHRNLCFSNKWLMDEELVDKDEHYITERLAEIIKSYEDRRVSICINKNYNDSYSMDELKESIGFVCNEGGEESFYPSGRESALAKHIIDIDKDLPVEEQNDILNGNRQTKKVNIVVRCQANRDNVTRIVKKYSEKFDKAPKNATIKTNMKITKERNGRVLDTTRIARELTEYLDSNSTDNFERSYQTSVVKAEVKASYLKPINTIIGSFATSFIPSNVRGKNIKLASTRINGTLLKPGDEVSYLEKLYDDSDGKKYGKAGGFLKNKIVQVEGGGICQVSTTSYLAFLSAGIIPKERHPHTCKVSYAQSGLDAALAVGTKDLVVANTLERPILIRARVNGGRLIVEVLSYKDAKRGYTYKARTKSKRGSLTVKSYLDVYKGGKKVETKQLATDTYKKLR